MSAKYFNWFHQSCYCFVPLPPFITLENAKCKMHTVIGAIKWPRDTRQLNLCQRCSCEEYIHRDVLTWLKQMKPATWKIKTVFFKGLFSIFSFTYQNLCPFDKLMLCARLWFCYNSFGRCVNWKKLLTFHMRSFLPSFTLHLNVSSAVHGRIDMKCTANPCEKSRKNNHLYLRHLLQNYNRTSRIPLDTWKASTESKEYCLAQLMQTFSEIGSSIWIGWAKGAQQTSKRSTQVYSLQAA